VVLRDGHNSDEAMKRTLCGFVADRLTHYKQPREILFVDSVPRTPSGKILRRELRKVFS
jgi:acyl-coenzyme A synthetase/AMP-(fatty) acid ligase